MVGRGGLVVSVVIVPTNIRRGCHTESRCDTPTSVTTYLEVYDVLSGRVPHCA
jgi:hypothetical protein